MKIIVVVLLIMFACFAAYREKQDQPNSYKQGYPADNDPISRICRKVKYCLDSDTKTIKWRRSFISAIIATISLFAIVHCRIPETKELVLYILVIYIVYYMMWHNYTATTSAVAAKIGNDNLIKLKKKWEDTI